MSQSLFFIDRIEEQKLFRDFITNIASQKSHEWLLNFYGPNGVGKSYLLRHLYRQLRPENSFASWVEFDPCNLGIFRELAQRISPYLASTDVVAVYMRRINEIEGRRLQTRVYQSSNLSGETDPRAAAVEAFTKLVEYLSHPLTIFVDAISITGSQACSEQDNWFIRDVLWPAYQAAPDRLRIVAVSNAPLFKNELDRVVYIQLPEFPFAEIRNIMEANHIYDVPLQNQLFRWAQGKISLIKHMIMLHDLGFDDFSGEPPWTGYEDAHLWLTDRILPLMTDARSRAALEYGVVLHYWTLPLIERVCNKAVADLPPFDRSWLKQFKNYPFIEPVPMMNTFSWRQFVSVIRKTRTKVLWEKPDQSFVTSHVAARDYFAYLDSTN